MPRSFGIGHNSFLLSTYEYRLLQHSWCCSSLVGFKYTLSLFSSIMIYIHNALNCSYIQFIAIRLG
nr:MAG TPA: hypothetical protein [Caudoviricetes sp.]